jgi:hypothetical protein
MEKKFLLMNHGKGVYDFYSSCKELQIVLENLKLEGKNVLRV